MGNDQSSAAKARARALASPAVTCKIHLFGSSFADKAELVAEFCHDPEVAQISPVRHSSSGNTCEVLSQRAIMFHNTAVNVVFYDNYTAYFRDADALLVVFDSSDRKSLTFARKMMEHLRDNPKEAPHVVALVGNAHVPLDSHTSSSGRTIGTSAGGLGGSLGIRVDGAKADDSGSGNAGGGIAGADTGEENLSKSVGRLGAGVRVSRQLARSGSFSRAVYHASESSMKEPGARLDKPPAEHHMHGEFAPRQRSGTHGAHPSSARGPGPSEPLGGTIGAGAGAGADGDGSAKKRASDESGTQRQLTYELVAEQAQQLADIVGVEFFQTCACRAARLTNDIVVHQLLRRVVARACSRIFKDRAIPLRPSKGRSASVDDATRGHERRAVSLDWLRGGGRDPRAESAETRQERSKEGSVDNDSNTRSDLIHVLRVEAGAASGVLASARVRGRVRAPPHDRFGVRVSPSVSPAASWDAADPTQGAAPGGHGSLSTQQHQQRLSQERGAPAESGRSQSTFEEPLARALSREPHQQLRAQEGFAHDDDDDQRDGCAQASAPSNLECSAAGGITARVVADPEHGRPLSEHTHSSRNVPRRSNLTRPGGKHAGSAQERVRQHRRALRQTISEQRDEQRQLQEHRQLERSLGHAKRKAHMRPKSEQSISSMDWDEVVTWVWDEPAAAKWHGNLLSSTERATRNSTITSTSTGSRSPVLSSERAVRLSLPAAARQRSASSPQAPQPRVFEQVEPGASRLHVLGGNTPSPANRRCSTEDGSQSVLDSEVAIRAREQLRADGDQEAEFDARLHVSPVRISGGGGGGGGGPVASGGIMSSFKGAMAASMMLASAGSPGYSKGQHTARRQRRSAEPKEQGKRSQQERQQPMGQEERAEQGVAFGQAVAQMAPARSPREPKQRESLDSATPVVAPKAWERSYSTYEQDSIGADRFRDLGGLGIRPSPMKSGAFADAGGSIDDDNRLSMGALLIAVPDKGAKVQRLGPPIAAQWHNQHLKGTPDMPFGLERFHLSHSLLREDETFFCFRLFDRCAVCQKRLTDRRQTYCCKRCGCGACDSEECRAQVMATECLFNKSGGQHGSGGEEGDELRSGGGAAEAAGRGSPRPSIPCDESRTPEPREPPRSSGLMPQPVGSIAPQTTPRRARQRLLQMLHPAILLSMAKFKERLSRDISRADMLELMESFHGMLSSIFLPLRDKMHKTDEVQLKRDLGRERIMVDGEELEAEVDAKGRPCLARLRQKVIAAVQSTATRNIPASLRIVAEVLAASSRTVSGADSYQVVAHLFSHPELDLSIRPNEDVSPISIQTRDCGRGVVEVVVASRFDVFRQESDLMGMEQPEQWLPIEAVVRERIDFLEHMTERTMVISSPEVSDLRYEEKSAQDCGFLNNIDDLGFC
jgi:hypothetical protein